MARPRTDIRERIVLGARQEFLALGVDGASLRTIAKQAGTSLGMIYYYYPSKDELFLAVIEGPYQTFLEQLNEGLRSAGTFEERLTRLFSVFSTLSELERSTLRLIAREMLGSKERLKKSIELFQRGHFPLLFALLQNGVSEDKVAPGYHPIVLLGLMGGIGVVPQILMEVAGPSLPFPSPPTEELVQTLAQAYIRAVSTPPAKFAEK